MSITKRPRTFRDDEGRGTALGGMAASAGKGPGSGC